MVCTCPRLNVATCGPISCQCLAGCDTPGSHTLVVERGWCRVSAGGALSSTSGLGGLRSVSVYPLLLVQMQRVTRSALVHKQTSRNRHNQAEVSNTTLDQTKVDSQIMHSLQPEDLQSHHAGWG